MVKVGKCALMHKKWTDRVGLTKKTSHCKSRDFLRKRRLNLGKKDDKQNSDAVGTQGEMFERKSQ